MLPARGFIEGYYGNPWSTQDRINLMKWGGYYKLNSYFYAPKNDPKHNSGWRELYTDEEIETLIKPLADAGNASKCRFVYALHTFMNNPVRFDTEEELSGRSGNRAGKIRAGHCSGRPDRWLFLRTTRQMSEVKTISDS